MNQTIQPNFGGLVKINAKDPRDRAHGAVGRLIAQRPRAGEPDGPYYLVDFGIRGSLVVNGKHFDAYPPSI